MGRILLFSIGGIVAGVAAIKLLFGLLAIVAGMLWFVVAKLVPLILIGWLAVTVWRRWIVRPAL